METTNMETSTIETTTSMETGVASSAEIDDSNNVDNKAEDITEEPNTTNIDNINSSSDNNCNKEDSDINKDKEEDDNRISNNNFNSDELTTPEVVVEQLKTIAESGTLHIDWLDLQRALKLRLSNVLDHYIERNRDSSKEDQYQEPNVEKFNLEHSRNELLELISSFAEAPFTIQRICELLYTPFKYYDKISTFLRGLEKNLRVISPVTWPKEQVEPSATKNDST